VPRYTCPIKAEGKIAGKNEFRAFWQQTQGPKPRPAHSTLLHLLFPPAAEGLVQTVADLDGEREEFAVTVEFDRLAHGIEHHVAMVAHLEVLLELPLEVSFYFPLEVVGNLLDTILAV
jgi:hypothetical protein